MATDTYIPSSVKRLTLKVIIEAFSRGRTYGFDNGYSIRLMDGNRKRSLAEVARMTRKELRAAVKWDNLSVFRFGNEYAGPADSPVWKGLTWYITHM